MTTSVGKGVAFPFRINAKGRVAMSNHDDFDIAKIDEALRIIVATVVGERIIEVEFGTRAIKLIFADSNPSVDSAVVALLTRAIQHWEPRIELRDVDIIRENNKIFVKVDYRVLTTEVLKITLIELGDIQ